MLHTERTFERAGSSPPRSTSERLFDAQLNSLGVPSSGLHAAELKNARALDPTVSAADISRIQSIFDSAQHRFFILNRASVHAGTKMLFAPTNAVVDIPVTQRGWEALVTRAINESSLEELQSLINQGPPRGGLVFECSSPQELIASVVRYAHTKGSLKTRIRAGDSVRRWIEETLAPLGDGVEARLGGVSAVGSLLSNVLGAQTTMLCSGPLNTRVFDFLPPQVSLVSSDGCRTSKITCPSHDCPAPNFALQWKVEGASPPQLSLAEKLFLPSSSLDILITSSGKKPGFEGIEIETLRSLGASASVSVVNGVQHLSTQEDAHSYLSAIRALRQGGCANALLFTVPSSEHARTALYRELCTKLGTGQCFDFLGMNAHEADGLLHHLYQAAQSAALGERSPEILSLLKHRSLDSPDDESVWGSCAENPLSAIHHALLLQDILGVSLVRLRSHSLDVLVSRFVPRNPEEVRDHLIVSRNLGTLKAAHHEGVLNSPDDLAPLKNLPDGAHIAALHTGADALAAWLHPTAELAAPFASELKQNLWARMPDGRAIFITPTIPFYDRSGGNVSAGDTKDVSFVTLQALGILAEARNESRAKTE